MRFKVLLIIPEIEPVAKEAERRDQTLVGPIITPIKSNSSPDYLGGKTSTPVNPT